MLLTSAAEEEERGKGEMCSPPLFNPNDLVWLTSAASCNHGNRNLPGNCQQGDGMLANILMDIDTLCLSLDNMLSSIEIGGKNSAKWNDA